MSVLLNISYALKTELSGSQSWIDFLFSQEPLQQKATLVIAAAEETAAITDIPAEETAAGIMLSGGYFHWILIFGLIILTSMSLTLFFWNYYIRSIYIKDGPALVPEKWGTIIADLTTDSKIHHRRLQTSLLEVQQRSEEQSNNSSELLKSFLAMQTALNARDEENARLKKGYDGKIFKKFLSRFIRVDGSLQELRGEFSDPEQQKNYTYLLRSMQAALEECGVERFIPEVGSDYRDAGSELDENPSIVETDDKTKDYKIHEVVSIGYILEGEGGSEVIVPSKVAILRFIDQGKS